jgi:hypothetical protein
MSTFVELGHQLLARLHVTSSAQIGLLAELERAIVARRRALETQRVPLIRGSGGSTTDGDDATEPIAQSRAPSVAPPRGARGGAPAARARGNRRPSGGRGGGGGGGGGSAGAPTGAPPRAKDGAPITIAGSGEQGSFSDGPALSARFYFPFDCVEAPDGAALHITLI